MPTTPIPKAFVFTGRCLRITSRMARPRIALTAPTALANIAAEHVHTMAALCSGTKSRVQSFSSPFNLLSVCSIDAISSSVTEIFVSH